MFLWIPGAKKYPLMFGKIIKKKLYGEIFFMHGRVCGFSGNFIDIFPYDQTAEEEKNSKENRRKKT